MYKDDIKPLVGETRNVINSLVSLRDTALEYLNLMKQDYSLTPSPLIKKQIDKLQPEVTEFNTVITTAIVSLRNAVTAMISGANIGVDPNDDKEKLIFDANAKTNVVLPILNDIMDLLTEVDPKFGDKYKTLIANIIKTQQEARDSIIKQPETSVPDTTEDVEEESIVEETDTIEEVEEAVVEDEDDMAHYVPDQDEIDAELAKENESLDQSADNEFTNDIE